MGAIQGWPERRWYGEGHHSPYGGLSRDRLRPGFGCAHDGAGDEQHIGRGGAGGGTATLEKASAGTLAVPWALPACPPAGLARPIPVRMHNGTASAASPPPLAPASPASARTRCAPHRDGRLAHWNTPRLGLPACPRLPGSSGVSNSEINRQSWCLKVMRRQPRSPHSLSSAVSGPCPLPLPLAATSRLNLLQPPPPFTPAAPPLFTFVPIASRRRQGIAGTARRRRSGFFFTSFFFFSSSSPSSSSRRALPGGCCPPPPHVLRTIIWKLGGARRRAGCGKGKKACPAAAKQCRL